ncbi:TPA: hypothetical protein ACH3X3_014525 [Trebouxia sp. C0006]
MASTSPVKLSQPIVSAHLPFLTHQPLPQADQEVFLDANSDEEDKGAGSAGPGPEASGLELNMHAAHYHQPEAQAVMGQSGSGHSPEKQAAAQGKTSLVSHSKQLDIRFCCIHSAWKGSDFNNLATPTYLEPLGMSEQDKSARRSLHNYAGRFQRTATASPPPRSARPMTCLSN